MSVKDHTEVCTSINYFIRSVISHSNIVNRAQNSEKLLKTSIYLNDNIVTIENGDFLFPPPQYTRNIDILMYYISNVSIDLVMR